MRHNNADLLKGATGGGCSAGILVFIVISLTSILFAMRDVEIASWLPILILSAFGTALVATAVGTIAGILGATTGKPVLGALLGTLVFLLVSFAYVRLFLSPVEPRSNATIVVVWAAIIGYISGSVGTIVGCRNSATIAGTRLSIVLKRAVLFMPPIILVVIWNITEENDSHARSELFASGCYVTWNAIEHPEGRWDVHFLDSKVDDETLIRLLGLLARYSPLDLNLCNSQVTDQGIAHLRTLTHLVRLHLENTSISREAIDKLKNQLPQVTITK